MIGIRAIILHTLVVQGWTARIVGISDRFPAREDLSGGSVLMGNFQVFFLRNQVGRLGFGVSRAFRGFRALGV